MHAPHLCVPKRCHIDLECSAPPRRRGESGLKSTSAARAPAASSLEKRMRRAHVDAAFRRVEHLIERRGLALREVVEILDPSASGRCETSRVAGFVGAGRKRGVKEMSGGIGG